MPTFGQSPSWASYNFVDSGGGSNQVASGKLTFNANGWVTSVTVFVDYDTGSNAMNACVWNGSSGLIQSAGFTPGGGSRSVGGQHWHTVTLSGFFLGNGSQCYIGWTKANSGGNYVWSCGGGNAGGVASGGNPGSLGSLSGFPSGLGGQCGAYFTYTTVYAPTATTNAASSVGTTTATLNGTVNPEGLNTSYYFQWGTTTSYGNSTSTQNTGTNGSSFSDTAVSANLTGLTSGQTYHFRLVATNSIGTTFGADQQFTTSGIPNAPTLTAPANNAYQSVWQNGATFSWTYNPVSGSGQTAYFLKVTPAGGTTVWWNGSAWVTTETSVTSASGSVTISAANMVAGGVTSSVQTFTWTVKTTDNIGTGPYASAFTVNNEIPPAAPTLTSPANATYEDVSGTPTFSWTYNPTNGQGGQTNYAFRRKISGASQYSYWNAGSSSWQTTPIVWNALTTQSVTFPAAAWANGNTYNWSVATQDAGGQGPFAADFTVNAQAPPTVTVTGPTGTESSFQPVVAWTASFPSGASETAYQVRTFTAAQYGAGGFNPATSASMDDSGVVASTSGLSYQVATTLAPGAHRSYVNVTETGSETNVFNAFTSFTAAADTPNAPTLTATATTDPNTGAPMIQLQAQCEVNILSAVDSSFESGVGTYGGANATLAQSSAQFLDGAFSLTETAVAAADMSASSGLYAVSPSTQYALVASFRAAVTARTVVIQINWYTSGSVLISSSVGTGVTDSSTGWTQATAAGTSPSNAAFAIAVLQVNSPAASEVHYVDNVGLFPGSNTAWSLGGFLSTAGVVILRSDGVYVRLASIANPALLSAAPASQLVTVNDYEATPLTAYTYTAQVQATGANGVVISPASAAAGASLSTTQWWELDPTSPSGAINAQPIAWNSQQYEQGAAHTVLGQDTQNYVASAMQKKDITATMELFSATVHTAFLALVTSQKTVFFSSPFGESYYLRLAPAPGGGGGSGSKAHDTQLLPSTSSGPHRVFMITGIAQPRPSV